MRPITTTRRPRLDEAKNSRTAKRYKTSAIVKEAMKCGPPRSPKLRAQMVSARNNAAPSAHTRCAGLIFTVLRRPSWNVAAQFATLAATRPCAVLLPEQGVTPPRVASDHQPRQYRKKNM